MIYTENMFSGTYERNSMVQSMSLETEGGRGRGGGVRVQNEGRICPVCSKEEDWRYEATEVLEFWRFYARSLEISKQI
jgi:hypothetical protein